MKSLNPDFDSAGFAPTVIASTLASALWAVGTTAFGLVMMLTAAQAAAASNGSGAAGSHPAAPASAVAAGSNAAPKLDPTAIARGRYLVQTSGCNDCHTPGYAESGGRVPEDKWLIGDRLGWRGPWGTSYPTNLRQRIGALSVTDWLQLAHMMEPRPPMPWYNVRAMSDKDLEAIWQFVKSLGPAGEAAPAWMPPDKVPPQPYVQFPQ